MRKISECYDKNKQNNEKKYWKKKKFSKYDLVIKNSNVSILLLRRNIGTINSIFYGAIQSLHNDTIAINPFFDEIEKVYKRRKNEVKNET